MSADELKKVRDGQVQTLSVILEHVKAIRKKKLDKIEQYRYNIDILEKLDIENLHLITFLEKLIAGKKDPAMNEQLARLEKQIDEVCKKK